MTRAAQLGGGIAVVILLVAVLVLAFAGGGNTETSDSAASLATARDLERRVAADVESGVLARAGIVVGAQGIEDVDGRTCMYLALVNPTGPNRAWLQGRYGNGLCVPRDAFVGYVATFDGCPTSGSGPRIRVPDVRGLRAYDAAQRLRRAGFRTTCNRASVYRRPERYDESNALFVVRMCQRTARRGGPVRLQTEGWLPGGYRLVGEACGGPTKSGE